MTKITHEDVFRVLEKWAPKELAYDWDNVGLQVGNYSDVTTNVLVTLDVLEAVVDEAIEQNANLIIAHHPLLFKSLKQINIQTVQGKVIKKLLENDITVYASHTNLDIAEGGVNDLLCEALEITSTHTLLPVHEEKLFKLMVFVPQTHVEQVREALGDSGAGFIGNYSHCTFQTAGQGTFMPLEGTNPYIGEKGKLELVDELKIETVVKEKDIPTVVAAMKQAHPYEEVAYDLFPLSHVGQTFGLGRIVTLEKTVNVETFITNVKRAFNVDHLRVTGDLSKEIKKVAIVGGSGEKFLHHAKKAGADAYITGDVTFHHAQEAKEMGLVLIDPGHYIEKIMKHPVTEYLKNSFAQLHVIESKVNTDPFHFV